MPIYSPKKLPYKNGTPIKAGVLQEANMGSIFSCDWYLSDTDLGERPIAKRQGLKPHEFEAFSNIVLDCEYKAGLCNYIRNLTVDRT